MLQKKGVSAVSFGPSNGQKFRVTVGIFEPRHPRYNHGFKLHGIQMPPTAFLIPVNVHPLLGFWIGPDRLGTFHFHFHPLRGHVHANLLHLPRRLHSNGLCKKIFVIHPLLLPLSPKPARASSFHENPAELNGTAFRKRNMLHPATPLPNQAALHPEFPEEPSNP
jgi:hypothetical protein